MKSSIHLYAAGLLAMAAICGLALTCEAQVYRSSETYVTFAAPPVAAAPQEAPAPLDDDQLDDLLGPVALYPDSLLAQVLPASTYPMDVIVAAQWLQAHPQPNESAIDAQPWDDSVKAMVHYPTVLQMMFDHAEWTQALGVAFLNQPQDVTQAIQRLRREAMDAGNLQTTPQFQVADEYDGIQILPADPEVVYVPMYDPTIIYERRRIERPFTFGIGLAIGRWLDHDIDWDHHRVIVGSGWHNGWRFEDRRWKRDERPRDVIDVRSRPVYTRDAHGKTTIVEPSGGRPWSRNDAKPRPTLPPALVTHRTADAQDRGWRDDRGPAVARDVTVNNPRTHGKAFDLPVRTKVPPPLPPSHGATVLPPPAHGPTLLNDYQTKSQAQHEADRGHQSLPKSVITAPVTVAPIVHTPPPALTHVQTPTETKHTTIQVPSDPAQTSDESKRGHSSMRH